MARLALDLKLCVPAFRRVCLYRVYSFLDSPVADSAHAVNAALFILASCGAESSHFNDCAALVILLLSFSDASVGPSATFDRLTVLRLAQCPLTCVSMLPQESHKSLSWRPGGGNLRGIRHRSNDCSDIRLLRCPGNHAEPVIGRDILGWVDHPMAA